MYLSDKLVYVELHKTAGTHIGRCLQSILPGKQVGKHNRLPKDLRQRHIIGSIRNPWDWYVSLWAYGCSKKGSVWHQTCDKVNLRYYREQLTREMGRSSLSPGMLLRQLLSDFKKPTEQWREVYRDSSSAEQFQDWLTLVFSFERRFDLREGYGFSPLSMVTGLMGYRFFKLYSSLDENIYSKKLLNQNSDLLDLWNQHGFVDSFVRQENVIDDLLLALERAGEILSSSQKANLLKFDRQITNSSTRLETSHYYNKESIDLVNQREKEIIKLFNYLPPKLDLAQSE